MRGETLGTRIETRQRDRVSFVAVDRGLRSRRGVLVFSETSRAFVDLRSDARQIPTSPRQRKRKTCSSLNCNFTFDYVEGSQ